MSYDDRDEKELRDLMKTFQKDIPEKRVIKWNRVVQQSLERGKRSKWWELAVACLVGFMLGQAPYLLKTISPEEKILLSSSTTIERISINSGYE